MIHIRRNYETTKVEIEMAGVPSVGYHRFEISMELMSTDAELHTYYYRFRRHGVGENDLRMTITNQNREEFFTLKRIAAQARGRHVELFENNNLGARALAEGSVLA